MLLSTRGLPSGVPCTIVSNDSECLHCLHRLGYPLFECFLLCNLRDCVKMLFRRNGDVLAQIRDDARPLLSNIPHVLSNMADGAMKAVGANKKSASSVRGNAVLVVFLVYADNHPPQSGYKQMFQSCPCRIIIIVIHTEFRTTHVGRYATPRIESTSGLI